MDLSAFSRIVTHDDLDGVVSAALISRVSGIENFNFTGPVTVQEGRIAITEEDIVCDLPCPVRFGMWFDHHPGNLEDVRLRGLDPDSLPGSFAPEPSCARVVLNFFGDQFEFPDFIQETVARTDRIDSFDYRTMDQWREPRPERLITDSLAVSFQKAGRHHRYLGHLVPLLRDNPMEDVLEDEQVHHAVHQYQEMERRSLALVEQDASFHPDDPDREIVVVDLTRHNRRPDIIRNTAFILHPQALAVLLVMNQYKGRRKTNDLTFSMSLSFLMNTRQHTKDIGDIMRTLNIGDGHPGAGAGRISCRGKEEMILVKEGTVAEILRMWQEQ